MNTPASHTDFQSIQERFLEHARNTPKNLCIRVPRSKAEDAWELTYAEVDQWSDQLAKQLLDNDVKAGDRVGLCVERSAAAVAAMLAINKIGACYVPISPDYPKARAQLIVEDTGVKVAFSTPIFANKTKRVGVLTLLLEDRPDQNELPTSIKHHTGTPNDSAYVIYTSGSTGRPKGVEVPHRGVLRLIDTDNSYCEFGPDKRFLQLAPLFFDAATLEVWGPLLNGGCCVVQPGDGMPDPQMLANVLKTEAITTLWLTSSLFNWLIDNEALIDIPVKELLVGGEALSIAHIKRAYQQLPDVQLINGYGPTETTTFACCFPIPQSIPEDWTAIPIGRAIHKTDLFVCDDAGQQLPQGEQGELLIGGDGVALGYLNLPELSAERFIQLDNGDESVRVYRTGDQVRINDEGLVEYCGRIDDQVKLSGYRIELGEINHCLTQHPAIRDVASIVYTGETGNRRLVAYLVADSVAANDSATKNSVTEIRKFAQQALPHYMVPNAWMFIDQLPLTANGKLDRNALPEPVTARPDIGVPCVTAKDAVEELLASLWKEHLGLKEVGVNDRYFELGGTSIGAVNFVAQLSNEINQRIPIATFFYAPTIRSFVTALWSDHYDVMAKRFPEQANDYTQQEDDLSQYASASTANDEEIAIIGLAGRYPGAEDTDQLWNNLEQGVESLRFATDSELRSAGVNEEDIQDPEYVRAYFSLDDLEYFDASFFGYQPREAELMDPQHRLFLETAWTALDNAGYADVERFEGKIGVFGGTARDSYVHHYVSKHPVYSQDLSEFYVNMGNDKNFPSTRVAYKLNLKGPAINLQTACSTSGTALHIASLSLLNGECNIALIGGCRGLVPEKAGYRNLEESALSSDGHLHAFDANASGMVRGSGASFLVIKRLSDAIRDKDCIRAVIKASAINNDGNAKVGYTAPSVEGQSEVITQALVKSGLNPEQIGYVEAHGTGTLLGDPIEVAALTKSYRRFTDATDFCKLGSIKTNIGHLDAGSAATGMIKAVLSMEHKKIPPVVNFKKPNPNIDFENSPFTVNNTLQEWAVKEGEKRYAAVSSFGLGGTNFHAIFEQAPELQTNTPDTARPNHLMALSAKSVTSLDANIASVNHYCQTHPDRSIADIAYSVNTYRPEFQERAIFITDENRGASVQQLQRSTVSSAKNLVYLFANSITNNSTQKKTSIIHAAQILYREEKVFKQYIDVCADIFLTDHQIDVLAVLSKNNTSKNDNTLTAACQFCIEYALAKLCSNWSKTPDFVVADTATLASAACIADMLSLHKAIEVTVAIALDKKENTPTSGSSSHLARVLEDIIPAVAKVPLIAASNEEVISIPDLMETTTWLAENTPITLTQDFCKNVIKNDSALWLKIGCADIHTDNPSQLMPLLVNSNDSTAIYTQLQNTLGQLWLSGLPIQWNNFYKGQALSKVPLPTFKFDRSRFLIDLPERQPQIVLFDANSREELSHAVLNWQQALINQPELIKNSVIPLLDEHATCRLAISSNTPQEMANALSDNQVTQQLNLATPATPSELVYLLPGGGAQYLQMGRGLYELHPVVRSIMDKGFALFAANHGDDLRSLIFPNASTQAASESQIQRPALQLPAIFIIEVALAQLWMHWGAKPSALLGHSMGENTAAHLAGVLSFEEALELVSLRGKLFETVEPGGMLSCSLSEEQARTYLGDKLDLATLNGPNQSTISGAHNDLETLKAQLDKDDIDAQIIPIDIAAHSRYLDPILNDFRAYLESIELHKPQIPFISNLTGTWITDAQACDPDYWTKHLRSTVKFSAGVNTLLEKTELDKINYVFLEVGPGKILGSLVKLHSNESNQKSLNQKVVSSLRHNQEDVPDMVFTLNTLGQLWSQGVEIDWRTVQRDLPDSCIRLPLVVPAANTTIVTTPQTSVDTSLPLLANTAIQQSVPLPPATVSKSISRLEYIATAIKNTIYDMSGIPSESIDTDATFVDLGFDSLFLTQVNGQLKKLFKIKITLKQLMKEAPTISQLSAFIDNKLPEDALQDKLSVSESAPQSASRAIAIPALNMSGLTGNNGSLAQLLANQIQTSTALLAALQGNNTQVSVPQAIANTPVQIQAVKETDNDADTTPTEAVGHGPFRPIVKSITGELTEQQQQFLDEFIAFYADKTKNSKQAAADIRPYYADPRTVLGFKNLWKEITYSIVAERSKDGRTWDIDGNEYIDCMGGFGAIFFGHAPDFIMKAVKEQAEITVDYGPQSKKAGEVARLICEMTGMDRVSFCNTGSEAVLAATRIARTVTGNDLIVTFSGDYHGVFDEMLIRSQVIGGQRKNLPIAPGIPQDSNSNVLMLEYDNPESLAIIRERADEIAGVLIEPIQSRHPEIQPKAFIHEVRKITREAEIPMIFDEVITGFRLHPRGAQAWFDVDVDISCYGKVIGGGLPIGVVAGKSQFMDVLDGGPWQFGDDSFPEAGVTYFAGTFVRHPLAIAAAHEVVKKLKQEGPALHAALNRKTALFAEKVNQHYREQDIPVEIIYFGSVFLVRYRGESDYEFLFFLILRIYGAHHIWGPRPGFMTAAHTNEDIEKLTQAFIKAGEEFRRGGFFHALEDRTEEYYPWTAAQSELWLACELGANASAAYNEQVIFEIPNDIDPAIMEYAIDRTVNRHPALRSVVASDKQGMIVKHYMKPAFCFEDLSKLDDTAMNSELTQRLSANIDQAFDFFNGSLISTLLIKLDKKRYQLCIAASHLVCDGWSLEKIMEDIAGFYTAIAQGRHYQMSEVPTLETFHKADRAQRNSSDFSDAKAYWKTIYENTQPAVLDLPLDHPRTTLREFNGKRTEYRFQNDLIEPLRAYAKSKSCTSFVLFLTAFNVLLNRLSGETDIIVGVPAAGQPNIGLPKLVSHCVSFLPLRTAVDSQQTFEDLMFSVRDNFLDAKDNQDFSFSDILQNFDIPREAGRLPLVCTNFNLDFPFNKLEFDGVNAEFLTSPRNHVKYDLSFNLTDEGDFLRVEIDHCTDLFSDETVERWINSFKYILNQIASKPQSTIGEIKLLKQTEETTLVKTLNTTDRPYPLGQLTLHDLFSQQALKTPQQCALQFEQEQLSFKELDQKSSQLAHSLIALGAGTDTPVAILMDRSLSLPTALLAVLKAGSAYLPINISDPEHRIKTILDDANVQIAICDQVFTNYLPSHIQSIKTESIDTRIKDQSNQRPDVPCKPDSLAYIIYTSGSTGKPKGVMVEHKSICNHTLWLQEQFNLGANDCVLQKTPYTFDVSLWELFLPLTTGSKLVIAKPNGHQEVSYIIDLIEQHKITHIHFVASMLSLFLSSNELTRCKTLKCILSSGEAITPPLVAAYKKAFPKIPLCNLYGPTEAAVHTTYWECTETSGSVPIGKPIANTQCYVVNKDLALQPVGITGELLLGGVQIARGYLNQPELTAKKFIQNPFSDNPDERVYRTGDLVKCREDGVIEYIGRNDFQVKVRGLRIELGEIENALLNIESIKQAVVLVNTDLEKDNTSILAFICNSLDTPTKDLREQLKSTLPDYMIPQQFIPIDVMPLTSSGKVDRTALLEHVTIETKTNSDEDLPSSDNEIFLANIWKEFLDDDTIYCDDNFFDIGGHSLMAAKINLRIENECGIEIPLRAYISSSLRQIAKNHLDKSEPKEQGENTTNTTEETTKRKKKNFLNGIFKR